MKGHSTRQILGSIEMDGAVKAEPASLVLKCVCKNLGVATNLNHCLLQNIDTIMNVNIQFNNYVRSELEDVPQHLKYVGVSFCVSVGKNVLKWIDKKTATATARVFLG